MKKGSREDYRIPLFGSIGGLVFLLVAGGAGVGIYSLISGKEWSAGIPLGVVILIAAILLFTLCFGIIAIVARVRSRRSAPRAEEMSEFFTARISDYDEHMLNEVEGCREAYERIAELLPPDTQSLLDLGCGTGLELVEIFKKSPDLSVTGIDMCPTMLEKLRARFPDRAIRTLCEDFLNSQFADGFDAALSAEAMHHYTHEEKSELYRRISRAIKPGGVFILCDYMVDSIAEEDRLFTAGRALRERSGALPNERLHIDIPLCMETECTILTHSGFSSARVAFRKGCTTVIVAKTE